MRYLLGLLATIGLIIIILFLLLRGGGSSPTVKALNLADYAKTDSAAHFVIDGPVKADQDHQEVKIDVTADQVSFTLYKGYEHTVVTQQTYPNNQAAYATFLLALQNQKFTIGNSDKALRDERGYCPLGQRQIYSFTNGTDELMRFWSTGCGNKTFKGNIGPVTELFQHQVPNYDDLNDDVDLN